MAAKELTPLQLRFCEEYVVDLVASAAYRRAGFKAKGNAAEVNAARLLRNAQVQARVAALQADRAERTQVTADQVLAELALVAFSDVGQVLDFARADPRLLPANEIPEKARRALAAVKVKRYTEGHGNDARTVEVTEFKLWDKLSALEKLGRHLGVFKEAGGGGPQVSVQVIVGVDENKALGTKPAASNGAG